MPTLAPAHPALSSHRLEPQQLARLTYPTPYLLVDLGLVEQAYHRFQTALPGVRLAYAMKCNPDRPILERVHRLGGSFEIASYPELEMLMAIGVDPAEVIFSNPVKPASHIERAAAAGVWRFAFDSPAELAKLARHAPGCAVYVRLEVEDKQSVVPSEGKFGIAPDTAPHLLREAAQQGLRPYGIGFHVGSQKTTPHAWADTIETCGRLMRELQSDGIRLGMIDIGGGFAAHYADHTPDLEHFGRVITRAVAAHLPYEVELVAEPGRALVAESGVMVATIIGTAHRRGHHWVHLDVGAFNGMMESLESANQLLFPLADELGSAERQRYHVTGPSCDSQDTMLFDAELSAGLAAGHKVFIYSADEVYEALCDVSLYPQWNRGMQSVSYAGRLKPGLEYQTVTEVMNGQTNVASILVVALEPDRKIVLNSQTGLIMFDAAFNLQPVTDTSCTVTCSLHLEFSRKIVNLARPMIEAMAEERVRGDLETLKRLFAPLP
jgi:ornithine decarboxylase